MEESNRENNSNFKNSSKDSNKFEKYNFSTLTPVDNEYNDAFLILDKELKNDNVRNIAISGPYSSGKSSFMKSYIRNSESIKEDECLRISLATFEGNDKKQDKNSSTIIQNKNQGNDSKFEGKSKSEDNENNDDNLKLKNENDVSNFIEKVIIEKLFYSKSTIYVIKKTLISLLGLISFCIIITSIFDLYIIKNYRKDLIDIYIKHLRCRSIVLIFALMGLMYALYAFNKEFHLIKKITFKGLEIEDKNAKEENLLNDNLEFIIKQFKEKGYKYIIFDDIDRFNNTLIFERLRDLNTTLNNYFKYRIVFIYEIRDDLFENQDRTKFFDFILPIIPYVGYDNSADVIYKAFREHNINEDELSPLLINEISTYLLDGRIISNIVNEYIIYKENLGKHHFSNDELFSMMIYKNVCPKDYAMLQNNEGQIYNLFKNKKSEYLENEKIKLINLLKEKKNNDFKDQYLLEIRNLLCISLSKSNIKSISNESNIFIINNSDDYYKIPEDIIKTGSSNINVSTYPYNNNYNLIQLLKENKNNLNLFDDLVNRINNIDSEVDKKIEETNRIISNIENSTMSDLINSDFTFLDNLKLGKYTELIKLLLNEGYINENYAIYMSKYEEGKISPVDIDFITNVRANNTLPLFDKELKAAKEVINRLGKNDFKKEQIINVSIANTVFNPGFTNEAFIVREIKNSKNIKIIKSDREKKKNNFITTLVNSPREIEFILLCYRKMNVTVYKEFINSIYAIDNNLCNKVIMSNIEEKSKNVLINSIIINIPFETINNINEVKEYISHNQILLNDNVELIEKLNIRYTNLSKIKENNIKIYDEIIEKNLYKLNNANILTIINNNDNFYNKNLNSIETDPRLYKNVIQNINQYVSEIYSKLEKQCSNNICVAKILNEEDLIKENRQIILEKEQKSFKDILIVNKEIWSELIEYSLFEANLNNINNYYLEYGLDDNLIQIINQLNINKNNENVDVLSDDLIRDIIFSEKINTDVAMYIIKNSKYTIKIEDIDDNGNKDFIESRLIKLINCGNIKYSIKMLNKLREYSFNVWLRLLRSDRNKTTNTLKYKEIELNNNEISDIVLDDSQTELTKFYAICQFKFEENSTEIIEKTKRKSISILINKSNYKYYLEDYKIIEGLLTSTTTKQQDKVRLVNDYFNLINTDNIKNVLINIKNKRDSFYKIIQDKKKPVIPNTPDNKLLIENLNTLGFKIEINKENEKEIHIKGSAKKS